MPDSAEGAAKIVGEEGGKEAGSQGSSHGSGNKMRLNFFFFPLPWQPSAQCQHPMLLRETLSHPL